MIGFALVLFLGAAAGWIAANGAPSRPRGYLRIAVVLYGAMAVSVAFGIAPPAVRDIVMTLGAALLCIAAYASFRKKPRLVSTVAILVISAAAGVVAAALGQAVLAAAPQVVSAIFMLLIARRGVLMGQRSSIYLALSALCVLGAAACALSPGQTEMARAGLLLFAAAGVAGACLASNLLVEERGRRTRCLTIGRAR